MFDVLTFDKDNMHNCCILDSDGQVLYQVESFGRLSKTKYSRGSTLLATVIRRDILPDQIEFASDNNGSRLVRNWLKPKNLLSSLPVAFEHDSKVYVWDQRDDGIMTLITEDTIAFFHPPTRQSIEGKSTLVAPHIDIIQGTDVPTKDLVVVSGIMLAQKVRWHQGNSFTYGSVTASILAGGVV